MLIMPEARNDGVSAGPPSETDPDRTSCPFARYQSDQRETICGIPPHCYSTRNCRCAGDIEQAVIAAVIAVLTRFRRYGLGATNRIDAALGIMRATATAFGDKSIERTFAAQWSAAHVEAFGPMPQPRTVRRWARAAGLKPPAVDPVSDVAPP